MALCFFRNLKFARPLVGGKAWDWKSWGHWRIAYAEFFSFSSRDNSVYSFKFCVTCAPLMFRRKRSRQRNRAPAAASPFQSSSRHPHPRGKHRPCLSIRILRRKSRTATSAHSSQREQSAQIVSPPVRYHFGYFSNKCNIDQRVIVKLVNQELLHTIINAIKELCSWIPN